MIFRLDESILLGAGEGMLGLDEFMLGVLKLRLLRHVFVWGFCLSWLSLTAVKMSLIAVNMSLTVVKVCLTGDCGC